MLGNEQVRFGGRPSEKGQLMAPRWRPTLPHVRFGGRPLGKGPATQAGASPGGPPTLPHA